MLSGLAESKDHPSKATSKESGANFHAIYIPNHGPSVWAPSPESSYNHHLPYAN